MLPRGAFPLAGAIVLAAALLAGCRHPTPTAAFTEESAQRGLLFAATPTFERPLDIRNTMGTGVALADFDGDGWLDVFLVGQEGLHPRGEGRLFLNQGDGTFADATAGSGLAVAGSWTGVAVGDIDNDGLDDLLLTGFGDCRLFLNLGGGRFADITEGSGLAPRSEYAWAMSAGFADVDGDGRLDLYVGRYLQFVPGAPRWCQIKGIRTGCGPWGYEAQQGSLYRNLGEGRFADVTEAWGLDGAHGKTLGVLFGDANDDGWPDLYLANDEIAGDLFLNEGGRRFRNVGEASGTAYREGGKNQGGMGVDWGDYNRDGRPDLFVTTFYTEGNSLYRNDGDAAFERISERAALQTISLRDVGFGTRFLDYDHDGWDDLIVANGHTLDNCQRIDATSRYRQPTRLFRNAGDGTFAHAAEDGGAALGRAIVGRGLATGDIDNDGDIDVVVTDLEGPVRLFINQAQRLTDRHWLSVRLVSAAAGRSPLGAVARVTAGGVTQRRECQTGGSFLSASDPRLHFGLGAATVADVEVRWPGGAVTRQHGVRADQHVTIREEG